MCIEDGDISLKLKVCERLEKSTLAFSLWLFSVGPDKKLFGLLRRAALAGVEAMGQVGCPELFFVGIAVGGLSNKKLNC